MRIAKATSVGVARNTDCLSEVKKLRPLGTETTMNTHTYSLGDLITLFYEEYLALYGDEELASVAAAATINDILAGEARQRDQDEKAA